MIGKIIRGLILVVLVTGAAVWLCIASHTDPKPQRNYKLGSGLTATCAWQQPDVSQDFHDCTDEVKAGGGVVIPRITVEGLTPTDWDLLVQQPDNYTAIYDNGDGGNPDLKFLDTNADMAGRHGEASTFFQPRAGEQPPAKGRSLHIKLTLKRSSEDLKNAQSYDFDIFAK